MTVRRVEEIERIDSLASFSSYIATEFGIWLYDLERLKKNFVKYFSLLVH